MPKRYWMVGGRDEGGEAAFLNTAIGPPQDEPAMMVFTTQENCVNWIEGMKKMTEQMKAQDLTPVPVSMKLVPIIARQAMDNGVRYWTLDPPTSDDVVTKFAYIEPLAGIEGGG